MSMTILYRLNWKVLFSVCALSFAASIFFFIQRPEPVSREGLVPLRMPLNRDINIRTIGQFAVEYSELHYVGLDFQHVALGSPADSLRKVTVDRIGSKEFFPRAIGITWRIADGEKEIAHGGGNDQYRGMVGNTITLGEFTPISGRTYQIEVSTDSSFSRFLQSAPTLEVGVATASVSVGLAFVEGFWAYIWEFAGVAFLIIAVMFLLISFAAYRARRVAGERTPPPQDK